MKNINFFYIVGFQLTFKDNMCVNAWVYLNAFFSLGCLGLRCSWELFSSVVCRPRPNCSAWTSLPWFPYCRARALGTRAPGVVAFLALECGLTHSDLWGTTVLWVYLLCSTWKLPRAGIQPAPSAVTERFWPNVPQGSLLKEEHQSCNKQLHRKSS